MTMPRLRSFLFANSISEITANILVYALLIALSIELFTTGIAQKIFYLVGYVATAVVVYSAIKNRASLNRLYPALPFILTLLFIGLVRYGWFIFAKADTSHFSEFDLNNLKNYELSGKRFVISAVTLSAALILSDAVSRQTIKAGKIIILVGLMISGLFAAHEFFYVTHDRVKLTADAASSSSYIVLFMYSAYLILSKNTARAGWLLVDIACAVVVFALLLLCDTRISILAFIGVNIVYALCNKNIRVYFRHKVFIFAGVALVVAILLGTGSRWLEGIQNIQNYKTDSSTSLGARVAIWDSGLSYSSQHYFFSTPLERTTFAQKFIKENHPGNTEGYNNVKYNMHNEFLEVLTLQGLIGLISLGLLYIVFFFVALHGRILGMAILPLFVLFVCGLTDSVLINSQTAMIFLIAITLAGVLSRKNE